MNLDKQLAKHQLEPGELTYALKQDISRDLLSILDEAKKTKSTNHTEYVRMRIKDYCS